MKKTTPLSVLVVAVLLAVVVMAQAQQPKVHRVGIITAGGQWYEMIDGLRVGLRELGVEEGKQFVFAIRETKGDAKAAEEVARILELEKVNLIYTTQTSVALAAKRATTDISVVFCAGADPVAAGLVASFAKPEGRLTGVFYRDTDLTAKRLEILKGIVSKLHRVVTFYNPNNPVASESAKLVREETARMRGIELIEKHVASVEELEASLRALKIGDVDAIFEVSDALVSVQDQLIIDFARVKRLPTIFISQTSVVKGGLHVQH